MSTYAVRPVGPVGGPAPVAYTCLRVKSGWSCVSGTGPSHPRAVGPARAGPAAPGAWVLKDLTDRQLLFVVPMTEKSGSPNEFWMYQFVTVFGWKMSALL